MGSATLEELVPMVDVPDIAGAIAFWESLGFELLGLATTPPSVDTEPKEDAGDDHRPLTQHSQPRNSRRHPGLSLTLSNGSEFCCRTLFAATASVASRTL